MRPRASALAVAFEIALGVALRVALRVALGIALIGAAPLANAQETPDLDASLATCQAHVENEKWAEGEAAVRKLLVDFDEDKRLYGYLEEIEEDLKLCLFRQAVSKPSGEDLFGVAHKRFDLRSRAVTLRYSRPSGRGWEQADGMAILSTRLDGAFTLEFDADAVDRDGARLSVLVCYDIERDGGYVVSPGIERSSGYMSMASTIRRVSGEDMKELGSKPPPRGYKSEGGFVVVRSGASLTLKAGGKTLAKGSDGRFKSGYIAFVGALKSVRNVRLKGKVDKHHLRTMVGEFLGDALAEWEDQSWDRTQELPAWLLDGPAEHQHPSLLQWPRDLPRHGRPALNGVLGKFLNGDELGFVASLRTLPSPLPTLTSHYLAGLAAAAMRQYRKAETNLTRVIDEDPEFGPARIFRGLARFSRRDHDGAREDLEAALKTSPEYPQVHSGLALLRLFAHDVDGAQQILVDATAQGIRDESLDVLRAWVHRARRGPTWTRRFEHETDHYVVRSDHGKKLCYDVATSLESMRKRYARHMGEAQAPGEKARVYVFSDRLGYLEYAGDLGLDLEMTSGVYLPVLRELALWVPADRTDFDSTVRHEGFHQYLHQFVEGAPHWFNEGWAEVFGDTRYLERRKRPAAMQLLVRSRRSVRDLLLADPAEFMSEAPTNYALADELVRFLRDTKDKDFKGLLVAYRDALYAGASRQEAFDEVFEPHIRRLETEFQAALAAAARGR